MKYAMLSVFLVAGCAASPEVRYVTKEVKVPVPVKCEVSIPPEPRWATKDVKPEANIFDKVKALASEIEQREGFDIVLRSIIESCSK